MDQRLPLQDVHWVAARCRAIRLTSGLNQTDFAKLARIGYTSWNAYEKGDALISIVSARKVRARTRVPLDYIYEGDCSMLPSHLADKLDEYGLRDEAA